MNVLLLNCHPKKGDRLTFKFINGYTDVIIAKNIFLMISVLLEITIYIKNYLMAK